MYKACIGWGVCVPAFSISGVDMAEIAAWQRKNYKKVQSFADGGTPEFQAPPERLSLTEEERVKQEDARDLSTIKDVDLKEKKEKKPLPQFTPIAAGKIQVEMDNYQAPSPYREEGRYTSRLMAAAGLADGGLAKKRKR